VVADADTIIAQKQMCEARGFYMISAASAFTSEETDVESRKSLIVDPVIYRYVTVETTQQHPLNLASREVARRITAMLR
jgi:hypothetical protein